MDGRATIMAKRCWIFALTILFLSSAKLVGAQTNPLGVLKVAPGQTIRIGIYTSIRPDCTSGALPALRLAHAPAHGTISVKRAMLKATNVKQCLAIDVPAFVAFYRAAADFNGADEFELEVAFASGRKELQHFRVSAAGSNAGQGI
jgi:hypothetical protein